MNKEVPWKRYWCPVPGSVTIDDDGYLWNPQWLLGFQAQEHLRTLPDLELENCLILLGEPGSGKSTEVRQEATRLLGAGKRTLVIKMLGITDIKDIEEDPAIKTWLQEKDTLILFLDALDECPMGFPVLIEKLKNWLAGIPKERLCLRLTCRSADWPDQLMMDGLKNVYSSSEKYEACPLDKEAVGLALADAGLPVKETLKSFQNIGAGSFASKPLTLNMLIEQLEDRKSLPKRPSELFYRSCLALCNEHNQVKTSTGKTGSLGENKSLIVAARIAAFMLVSRQESITTNPRSAQDKQSLYVADIAGGKEKYDGVEFEVDEKAIREVLSTGLFTLRGLNRHGLAHQAYTDFLAAWYFKHKELSRKQLDNLLDHPVSHVVIPHLTECAAWLAALDRQYLQKLLIAQPEVLLRTDGEALGPEERRKVTRALLDAVDQQRILDSQLSSRGYPKLANPKIGEDLKPYIRDKSKNWRVRRLALNLAETCRVQSVVNDLIKVALDPTEEEYAREYAAYAIRRIGNAKAVKRLKPLLRAAGKAGEELMGIAINALYPEHLSLSDALGFVGQRQTGGTLRAGACEIFLSDLEHTELSDDDLATILSWSENQGPSQTMYYSNKNFIEKMLENSWGKLKKAKIADRLADAITVRLRLEGGWSRSLLGIPENPSDEQRMDIARFVIEREIVKGGDLISLAWDRHPLLRRTDLDALFEELAQCPAEFRSAWVQLIKELADLRDGATFTKLFNAFSTNPELQAAFAHDLEPVLIDSDAARQMKASLERHKEQLERQEEIEEERRKPNLQEAMAIPEDKPYSKWAAIAWAVGEDQDGILPRRDIEASKGWIDADPVKRKALQNAALAFLKTCMPQEKLWRGTRQVTSHLFYGHPALRLLFVTAPEIFESLSNEVLAAWSGSFVVYPYDPDETDEKVLKRIYEKVPGEVLEELRASIQDGRRHTRHFKLCWDQSIEQVIREEIFKAELEPASFESGLRTLIPNGSEESLQAAWDEFEKKPRTNEHAIAAVQVSLPLKPSATWPRLKELIGKEPDFVKQAITKTIHELHDEDRLIADMPLTQRAELVTWLEEQFPHQSDPPLANGRVTEGRSVTDYREAVLISIRDSGDPESIPIIQGLQQRFPSDTRLPGVLILAKDAVTRKTVPVISIEDLKAVFKHRDVRMIRSSEELLDLIIESLERLETDLQGTNPEARGLWNEHKDGNHPKDESALSDKIKNHLKKDLKGLVANREVEVRKAKPGPARGDSIDVHVTRPGTDNDEELVVTIEVKGDWNEGVMASMKAQLLEQYLLPNRQHAGLYIIGWFDSESKSSKVEAKNLAEARQAFTEQAARLTTESVTLRAFVLDVRFSTGKKSKSKSQKKRMAMKAESKNKKKKSR